MQYFQNLPQSFEALADHRDLLVESNNAISRDIAQELGILQMEAQGGHIDFDSFKSRMFALRERIDREALTLGPVDYGRATDNAKGMYKCIEKRSNRERYALHALACNHSLPLSQSRPKARDFVASVVNGAPMVDMSAREPNGEGRVRAYFSHLPTIQSSYGSPERDNELAEQWRLLGSSSNPTAWLIAQELNALHDRLFTCNVDFGAFHDQALF